MVGPLRLLVRIDIDEDVGRGHPRGDGRPECLDDDLGRDVSDQCEQGHSVVMVEWVSEQRDFTIRRWCRRRRIERLLARAAETSPLFVDTLLLLRRQAPSL